jgi:peptidoglycan-associated lipoprotein
MTRWVAISCLALFFGCAHQQPKKDEPQPVAPAAKVSKSSSSVASQDSDASAAGKDCGVVRVHFPLDSTEIDPADKDALQKSAECLKANKALRVTIEGNADERGTEEYNLALGDRRANAVSKYLQALGASSLQLQTVSYGKNNPECNEHDEACWAKNRRAAVKPKN